MNLNNVNVYSIEAKGNENQGSIKGLPISVTYRKGVWYANVHLKWIWAKYVAQVATKGGNSQIIADAARDKEFEKVSN